MLPYSVQQQATDRRANPLMLLSTAATPSTQISKIYQDKLHVFNILPVSGIAFTALAPWDLDTGDTGQTDYF